MKVLLKALQTRATRVAITASTARSQVRGTVAATRAYFDAMPLEDFRVTSESAFRRVLDRHTLGLKRRLPRGGRHWGVARKFLNIFLRDVVYTTHLVDGYRLRRIEPWLELPLDSITAKRLVAMCDGVRTLPKWPNLRRVTRKQSADYQAAATWAAQGYGVDRVHLDAFFWGVRD